MFVGYSEESKNTQHHDKPSREFWATQLQFLKRTLQTLNWQMRLAFADHHPKVNGENWGVTHPANIKNTAFTIKNHLN